MRALILLAAAAAAAGCGGGQPATGPEPAPPEVRRRDRPHPLCTRLRGRAAGTVTARAAVEVSGLVLARPGVLWAHNDSGDEPRLLSIGTDGRLLAEVVLAGVEHVDWEALAYAGGDLYVGDIGDNEARRDRVVLHRVAPGATTPAERIDLRYPDGPQDAEALLADPLGDRLVVVTKRFDGRGRIYAGRRNGTLRRAGRLSLGIGEAVTAGDVSADGRTIVLRTYARAFVWSRRRGEALAATLRRRPCRARVNLIAEGQGETVALARDGGAFYTLPEGPRPVLRRYAPR